MDRLRAGEFCAIILGTPCATFSVARNRPPGPRPLRSPDQPYGLPRAQLSPKEQEELRLGTFFAVQSARLLKKLTD